MPSQHIIATITGVDDNVVSRSATRRAASTHVDAARHRGGNCTIPSAPGGTRRRDPSSQGRRPRALWGFIGKAQFDLGASSGGVSGVLASLVPRFLWVS